MAAFEVGLVAVGGQHLGVGQGGVVGDQGEAAVGGRVVGQHVEAGVGADGVAGAGVASVTGVRAGSAATFLPVGFLDPR
ncbi:MAG: hypothetical protein ACRDRK_18440 [Pseudonocardia sp.]